MSIEEEVKTLFAEADLGRECENFLEGPVGRYLLEQAIKEEDHAKTSLLLVNPADVERVRELQEMARVPKLMFVWIKEAIQRGKNAKTLLEGENHE